jgi:hypothetical protein
VAGCGWRLRKPLPDHLVVLPQLCLWAFRGQLSRPSCLWLLPASSASLNQRELGGARSRFQKSPRRPEVLPSVPSLCGGGRLCRIEATWFWRGWGLGTPPAPLAAVTQAAAVPASHEGGWRPPGGGGGSGWSRGGAVRQAGRQPGGAAREPLSHGGRGARSLGEFRWGRGVHADLGAESGSPRGVPFSRGSSPAWEEQPGTLLLLARPSSNFASKFPKPGRVRGAAAFFFASRSAPSEKWRGLGGLGEGSGFWLSLFWGAGWAGRCLVPRGGPPRVGIRLDPRSVPLGLSWVREAAGKARASQPSPPPLFCRGAEGTGRRGSDRGFPGGRGRSGGQAGMAARAGQEPGSRGPLGAV